jgi:hypothetical protein
MCRVRECICVFTAAAETTKEQRQHQKDKPAAKEQIHVLRLTWMGPMDPLSSPAKNTEPPMPTPPVRIPSSSNSYLGRGVCCVMLCDAVMVLCDAVMVLRDLSIDI